MLSGKTPEKGVGIARTQSGKARRGTEPEDLALIKWQFLGHCPKSGHGSVGPAACASAVEGVGEAVLRLVGFFGPQPATAVQPQLAESATQGLPPDPQPTGCLKLIPARVLQDAGQ